MFFSGESLQEERTKQPRNKKPLANTISDEGNTKSQIKLQGCLKKTFFHSLRYNSIAKFKIF